MRFNRFEIFQYYPQRLSGYYDAYHKEILIPETNNNYLFLCTLVYFPFHCGKKMLYNLD